MRNGAFYAQLAVFVVLGICLVGGDSPWWPVRPPFYVIAALGIAFGLLGLLVAVWTAWLPEARMRKAFFVLTGASGAGIPICAILHNLVYGLFIAWFGEGFWERHGMPDEPVFFILAVLVCPALFLIGSVGSIALLIRARIATRANAP